MADSDEPTDTSADNPELGPSVEEDEQAVPSDHDAASETPPPAKALAQRKQAAVDFIVEKAPSGEMREMLLESVVSYTQEIHSGPLPSPRVLAEYNKAMPGLGSDIVTTFKDESAHRRQLEKDEFALLQEEVRARIADRSRGMKFAFVICLAFLLGGVFVIYNGHDWAGGTMVGTTLVALVATFVVGRTQTPQQDSEKKKRTKKASAPTAPAVPSLPPPPSKPAALPPKSGQTVPKLQQPEKARKKRQRR